MKIKQKLISSLLTLGLIASSIFTSNVNAIEKVENNEVYKQEISSRKDDISGHWAESTIRDFISKGYIKGYSDGTFRPNNSITRAEFVVIFNNYFGLSKTSGKIFNDTANHWAKYAVDVAVTNGVCNGVTATEFKPNDPITREQVAVMISGYKKLNDTHHEELHKFKDMNNIASWAKNSVEGVVERNYMGGYSDSTFKPKNKITRAEAVATLSRVHKGAVPPVINTPIPTPPPTQPDPEPTPPPTESGYVYANGGSSTSNKYHKSATSHGMKGAIKMTVSEAKSKGYVPCKTCF